MSAIAANISGICAKDLISGEAKYHSSCYKAFVHIMYETDEAVNNPTEAMGNNNGEVYEAVYSFCEALISNPRVVEFKEVRNVLSDEEDKLGVVVTQSQYKNLLRLISNKFEQLVFLNYQQNKVLMYLSTLKLETVVVENFELKSDVANQTSLDENSKTVINAAKILNEKIKYHPRAMAWPPEEKDLGIDKVADCVPELLDTFCTILLSGQLLDRDKSRSDRIVRLKNSLAQDIVYSVSNGAIKTPKSVLFPSVVKALCNNTEVVKLISRCGHGIGYNLVEEIETEFALKAINEQTLNRVLIPDECKQFNNLPVALMVADNIDNLECTMSGAGTSHRVNSILVMKRQPQETFEENLEGDGEQYHPPVKRKCKRSLSADVITREIQDYYGGRRVGPGVLSHIQHLGITSSYEKMSRKLHIHYLVWIELRKLKTHPLLLVRSWTGFFIKIRDKVAVIQSTMGYLDTLDSPATDLKKAYEVLCRGREIKNKLQLNAVACVFDQAFYAKCFGSRKNNLKVHL
ncbi:Hypothetical predicted protein [Paramuricea clavata]|uniref:Uncharacterized protein n=1 Tax=Paramuricea clavata TaxID=317549 RepID=A0A7D9ED84_PARCT|nr:Hypothetical predicted protein [Paramuricea clavata]